MNQERRALVEGVIGVIQALPAQDVSRGLSRAVTRMIEGVLERELKSVNAMAPYADQPTTARNYRNGRVAINHLQGALEGMKKKDFPEVVLHLDDALHPEKSATYEEPAQVKKTKKKGKK